MVTCPNGHTSTATDYCDVCGTPIPPDAGILPDPAVGAEKLAAGEAVSPGAVLHGGTQPAPVAPESVNAEIKSCPNCRGANPGSALFCEECGYDFTTGSLPRGAEAPAEEPAGAPADEPAAEDPAGAEATEAAGGAGTKPAAVAPVRTLDLDSGDPLPPPVPAFSLPGDEEPAAADAAPAAKDPEDGHAEDADVVDADVVSVTDEAEADAEPAAPAVEPAVEKQPAGHEPVDADLIAEESVPQPAPDPEPLDAPEPPEPAVPDEPAPAVPQAVAPVAAGTPAAPAAAEPPVAAPAPEPGPSAPAASRPEEPGPAATGPAEWVVEVWIDPDWYAGQDSPDQLPSPGLPRIVGLRKRASLIGRPSRSRGIDPDIDCEPDTGVSRRHAELATDGTRWWVEDLGSSNGTYVGEAGAPLPEEPIRGRAELGEDSRVYVGSWTRLVVRRANPDEVDL